MTHLEAVPVEDLRRALDEVEGKTPTQRLLAAIAYKHGVPQTELAEWHGVERRTIYNWLSRLDRGPLVEAARDDRRSGRPRKLSDEQRERLAATLREPPAAAGYDAGTWTPDLVRQLLEEQFDVSYSRPSCRRLMTEAGLRYRPGAPDRRAGGGHGGDDDSDEGDARRTGRWVPE